jgi:7-cyano-7-deazaguanine synthase in queuosine biosynthesis
MAKDLAIILNNGSLNSSIVSAMAAQRYRLILIYVEPTANTASRLRAAYDQQVAHFKPYREHSIALPFLSSIQQPGESQAAAADHRQAGLLASQLLHLLPIISAAVPCAAFYQASAIYVGLRVGANADDLAQATEYLQVFNELVQLPCGRRDMEIVAPLLELESWQVVDVGHQLGAPMERGWSCLEEGTDPCGSCRGCRARDAAFQQAGKPDPLRSFRK